MKKLPELWPKKFIKKGQIYCGYMRYQAPGYKNIFLLLYYERKMKRYIIKEILSDGEITDANIFKRDSDIINYIRDNTLINSNNIIWTTSKNKRLSTYEIGWFLEEYLEKYPNTNMKKK